MTSQKNKGKYNSKSKSKSKSRFPTGMTNQKDNSNSKGKAWVPMHDGLIVMGGHPKLR